MAVLTAKQKLNRRAKSASRVPASLASVTKTGVKRRVNRAVKTVTGWSTTQKIAAATAAIAVPVLAAAFATVIVRRRRQAALATKSQAQRKSAKARRA